MSAGDGAHIGMINSDAVEIMCRWIYALFKAFERVQRLGDWKQPKGAGKWKTKVMWHLADEYDAIALEDQELQDDDVVQGHQAGFRAEGSGVAH